LASLWASLLLFPGITRPREPPSFLLFLEITRPREPPSSLLFSLRHNEA